MLSHIKIKLSLGICLFALLISHNGRAAGLGGIDLDSYLNQPLKARISLIGVPPDQVGAVTARLASAEDFQIMGIDQRRMNIPLYFTPKIWRGKAVIEVTSNDPVKDPILQFAVDVSWQRGHMLREYTLFLDPPTVPIAPPTKSSAKVAVPAAVAPAKIRAPVRTPELVEATRTQAPQVAVPTVKRVQTIQTSAGEYGPVSTGDTLWTIANNWRKDKQYSLNQSMVSIVRLNPSAFINGDINRMKKGHILRLPSAADVADISTAEANRIVNQQLSAWREQTTVTTAPPIISEQAAGQEEIAAASLSSTDASSDNQTSTETSGGRLELVPPAAEESELLERQLGQAGMASANKPVTGELQSLEDRMALAEEELLISRAENEQLDDQVQDLQAQIEALRSGMNLNDGELANMQQQMADRAAAADARADIDALLDEQSTDNTEANKTSFGTPDKSLLERYWWLAIAFLLLLIAYVIYYLRQGGQAEAQAADNFLDAVMLKQEQQTNVEAVSAQSNPESLAHDAEEILKVLEEDDALNRDSLLAVEEIEKSNGKASVEGLVVDGTKVKELDEDDVELREFLDKTRADKPATASDAMDHISVAAEQPEESGGGTAEEEIMDSLESDDDSDSERSAGIDDQVEVKLDLARAYLAMEDSQAAREILEGVLVQGSEAQQLEARNMLDELV